MHRITKEKHAPPLRLWLVRHGATAWNVEGRFCGLSDLPLSPLGELQALWLQQEFSAQAITGLHTSDLLRARQTAALLAPALSPQASALWRELSFGRWEGQTYTEIKASSTENELHFFTDPLHVSPPGGETLLDLEARVRQGLIALLEQHESAQSAPELILVSHAGVLRVLLCLLLHVPLDYYWQFQLATGSYSALDLSPGESGALPIASLALLNMRPPLEVVKEEHG